MDWVKAYLSIWTELQAYIKEYHTTGLTWSKSVSAGSGRALRGEPGAVTAAQTELVRAPFLFPALPGSCSHSRG